VKTVQCPDWDPIELNNDDKKLDDDYDDETLINHHCKDRGDGMPSRLYSSRNEQNSSGTIRHRQWLLYMHVVLYRILIPVRSLLDAHDCTGG
jgi:hypothetical protein